MRELTQSCALDGTLEGGERFRLGPDWWVRVVNAPGHTYGHIALFDERSRTLLAGEAALWHAILDVNDRPVLPPTYCYVDTYLQTIDRLLEFPMEVYSAAHWPSTATRRISALSCAKAANIVSSWRSSCCATGGSGDASRCEKRCKSWRRACAVGMRVAMACSPSRSAAIWRA